MGMEDVYEVDGQVHIIFIILKVRIHINKNKLHFISLSG